MTRKLQHLILEDCKSKKRVLKPVVEKKRRDRINQSLTELKSLLLKHTSDSRLQNPKLEKAEILELAVEYLQKWTYRANLSNDSTNGSKNAHAPVGNLHHSQPSAASVFALESAGFQQCVAHLTSYMHKITPSQRTNLWMPSAHQRGERSLLFCFYLTLHFSLSPVQHHVTIIPPLLPLPGFLSPSPHMPPLCPSLWPSCPPLPPSHHIETLLTPCTKGGVTAKLLLTHVETMVLIKWTKD